MRNSLLGAAKPAHGLEREHPFCLLCAKPITHPICPFCISEGFFTWMAKFPEEFRVCDKVRGFLSNHRRFSGGVRCISCHKKRASVCPKCFTNFLYQKVKEAGLGVRALLEFLFIFNFDFEHDTYSKELEHLGGF
ncbi:hypothetical protein D6829_02820 [Candidatus Pacearchaeota archaeon]|nr:MAG: hypothetical protein D6829_02820 [Candidatus Pacearchaeota archaeon]